MSARALVLGFILLTLAFAYAFPLRIYLAQEAEIDRMDAAQKLQERRIEGVAEKLSKWEDDEFVIAQARRRLHYVRPGEVAYVIVDSTANTAAGNGKSSAGGPWFSRLWSNVQAADNPRETDLTRLTAPN